MELSNPLVSDYTWANKPSVAPLGQIICVTDVGANGTLFRGNGTKWVRMSSLNYANIYASSSATGAGAVAAEVEVGRISYKGGTLGANGRLAFTCLGSATANGNTKTLRAKIGANTIGSIVSAGASLFGFNFWLMNLGSESSQRNNVGTTFAINTSVDFDVVFTVQLTVDTDTLGIVSVVGDLI
jgi:hypothetical protein